MRPLWIPLGPFPSLVGVLAMDLGSQSSFWGEGLVGHKVDRDLGLWWRGWGQPYPVSFLAYKSHQKVECKKVHP